MHEQIPKTHAYMYFLVLPVLMFFDYPTLPNDKVTTHCTKSLEDSKRKKITIYFKSHAVLRLEIFFKKKI